jgi:hypothetical protein
MLTLEFIIKDLVGDSLNINLHIGGFVVYVHFHVFVLVLLDHLQVADSLNSLARRPFFARDRFGLREAAGSGIITLESIQRLEVLATGGLVGGVGHGGVVLDVVGGHAFLQRFAPRPLHVGIPHLRRIVMVESVRGRSHPCVRLSE